MRGRKYQEGALAGRGGKKTRVDADAETGEKPGRVGKPGSRTLAALLAAFFSCFSLSTCAMISIWVSGRFSRFFALPLLRRPSPNSTECCGKSEATEAEG